MGYTNEEGYQMQEVLFEAGSFKAAAILWRQRYPDRLHHSRHVFARLSRRIQREGIVQPHHNKGKKIHRRIRDDRSADIVASVLVQPHDSIRRRERESGVSRSTIFNILKDNKFHPYKMILVQEINNNDLVQRLAFCNWFRQQAEDFQRRVLFSDECTFKSDGSVNTWNCRFWSQQNPHWLRPVDRQHVWKINLWCGIIDNKILGPIIIEGNLNRHRYVELMERQLPALLEEIPLDLRLSMWFQQDGCPAHTAVISRDTLDRVFPNRWMGKYGPVNFPPRSPDLTVLDYYLWGRLKDLVYQERPTTRENMIQRIRGAIRSLESAEIRRAVDDFRNRMQTCIRRGGADFRNRMQTCIRRGGAYVEH